MASNLNDVETGLMGTTATSTQEHLAGELDGELSKLASSATSYLKESSFKQIIQKQWFSLRSWASFLDFSRMRTPISTLQWSRRLTRNVDHFQANYLCVFFILVIYCILSSPLLLLAIAMCLLALYAVTSWRNSDQPFRLFGITLTINQMYMVIGLASFPLFWLAGAGSAVFWVLGASFVFIGIHASLYAIEASDASGDGPSFENFIPPPTNVQSI